MKVWHRHATRLAFENRSLVVYIDAAKLAGLKPGDVLPSGEVELFRVSFADIRAEFRRLVRRVKGKK